MSKLSAPVALAIVAGLVPFAAPAQTPAALALSCANCHGPDGRSPGEMPSIEGMTAEEIAASLRSFRSGEQEGTIMNRIARGYTDAEIEALSRYLAERGDTR